MNRFITCCLLLILFSSCNKLRRKAEANEYGKLFEKEYPSVEKSEAFIKFQERYQLLLSLSEKVDTSEQVEITDTAQVGPLCFIPPLEYEKHYDKQSESNRYSLLRITPFSEYVNLSHEVNATMVMSSFFKNVTDANAMIFDVERGLHRANNIPNKEKYTSETYEMIRYKTFCEDRILMDRINNSRYFLIMKGLKNISSRYRAEYKHEFIAGEFAAIIYVYDFSEKRFVSSLSVDTSNSSIVETNPQEVDVKLYSDLYDNISLEVEKAIYYKYGLTGKIDGFFLP